VPGGRTGVAADTVAVAVAVADAGTGESKGLHLSAGPAAVTGPAAAVVVGVTNGGAKGDESQLRS
jgi:hypothetical protein